MACKANAAVQLLVATGQGNIAYLEVEGSKLKQVAHHKLQVEVACLDLTPIGALTPLPPVPAFCHHTMHITSVCHLVQYLRERYDTIS